LYHQEIVANGGLAGRFDVLLRQWQTLETLNQQAMDRWDRLLQAKPLLSKPIVMTWGGVIAAVVLGVWLLGRGELIDTSTTYNIYYNISEKEFNEYKKYFGVTKTALANFFKILEQNNVDRADLDKKLREIAESYKELLENAKLLEGLDDPKVNDLLRQAREFTEGRDAQGNSVTVDFAKAKALLQRAIKQVQQRGDRLREVTEKAKAAEEKNQLLEARILAQQSGLADAQLKYADAGNYYQQAAELLPAGHEEDKGKYLNNAALAFHRAGKYEQALPLFQEALRIREEVLGKLHPDYATSLNNLAELYRAQGQYEQATQLLKEASEIFGQVLGKLHPDYATSLNDLAHLYHSQAKYEEALPLYQEASKIREKVLGKQHRDYALSLNNLALLYKEQGKNEEALPLLKEASEIFGQVLGKQHPYYVLSLNNLAGLYYSQGKYEEASPLLKKASMIFGQVLGKLHPDYALSLGNLAELYRTQGKNEEAVPLFQEALKIRDKVLGKQHPDYALSLNNLALLYYSQRKNEEALPLFQEALKIREKVLGKQHTDYAQSLNNLALLYDSQEKYEEALPLFQQALKIIEKVLGKHHTVYARIINNLAGLYRKQGRNEEALSLYQEARGIREKALGKQHPDYAQTLHDLALLYDSQGRYEQALPLLQQAVEIQTKALGEKHPNSQLFAENLRDTQEHLNGKYQVVVKQIVPGSSASLLGIEIGDIFTHYNQQSILGKSQFTEKFAKEFADTIGEFKLLRDGKMLTFQLKPNEIEVELEEKLKYEP